MESKVCKQCLTSKSLAEYRVNKGYSENVCKVCNKENSIAKSRTKVGLSKKIYSSQKYTSKKRNHNAPTYTREELYDWLMSQELFHKLYDNWKRLDYQTDYIPSVDRKDERIGYTISNIQLMTWGENHAQHSLDIESDTSRKYTRPISQYALDGTLIKEYISVADASRQLNIATASITEVCIGKSYEGKRRLQTGGFMFRYSDEVCEDSVEPIGAKKLNGGKKGKYPKGVTRKGDRYNASVYHDKKRHNVGTYSTIEEAEEAYKVARLQIKG